MEAIFMNTGLTVINNFFNKNYAQLLGISTEYSQRHRYDILEPDEIVSGLYLYTVKSDKRTTVLARLIKLSAETINYMYDNRGYYYIIEIINRLCKGRRTFENNMNTEKMSYNFVPDFPKLVTEEQEIKTSNYFGLDDVLETALDLSAGDNWYLYRVWYDYYVARLSYKELGKKYSLSTSPLFSMVRKYNGLIKTTLESKQVVAQ